MKKLGSLMFCLLIFSATPVFCCICDSIDKDFVESLKKEEDYILIGKATTNHYHNDYLTQFHNSSKNGTNVLLKVDSVIKGDLDLAKEVFVYQFGGDCDTVFEFGDSYLIFGRKINSFKAVNSDEDDYILKEGVLSIYADKEKIDFLNEQSRKYKIINTNYCISFYKDSKAYAQIEAYLENE